MPQVEQAQSGTQERYIPEHEKAAALVSRMDAVLQEQDAEFAARGVEGPDFHVRTHTTPPRGPDGKFIAAEENEDAVRETQGEETPEEVEEQQAEEKPVEKRKYKVAKQEEDDPDEVDEDELVAGYMRQRDYTRKRQKEAAETKAARANYHKELSEERERLTQAVHYAKATLVKALAPDLMDVKLDELWAADPQKAGVVQARLNRVHGTLQQVDQIIAAVTQKAQADRQAAYDEAVKEALEDLSTIPDWSDEKYGGMMRFAVKQYGFSQEEMANVVDARAVRMALDAQAYHELKKVKAQAEKAPPKKATELLPVKPTGQRTSNAHQGYAEARKVVSTNKTMEAGKAYFKEMFALEKKLTRR